MKKILMFLAGIIASSSAFAEDLTGVDKFICSASFAQICFESGECFRRTPADLSMPEFVVVDVKGKTVKTTKASGLNQSSKFNFINRTATTISLQGVEETRLFSFVINEKSGFLTVAIADDGYSMNVFGACTDAQVK